MKINLYNKDTGDCVELGEKQGPGDVKINDDLKVCAAFVSYVMSHEKGSLIVCSEETWETHEDNPANHSKSHRPLVDIRAGLVEMEEDWERRLASLETLLKKEEHRDGNQETKKRLEAKKSILSSMLRELKWVLGSKK